MNVQGLEVALDLLYALNPPLVPAPRVQSAVLTGPIACPAAAAR
jgi:hypothetical protein